MNIRILNRDGRLPDDGWYQVEVSGEHYNRQANVVQIIDAKAIDSIVNRFQEEAQAENFAGILIDEDHFSLDPDKSTSAKGWAMELRNRADGAGFDARIDWTTAGRPLVEGKVFKFFSTVYEPADLEAAGTRQIKNRDVRAVRPLRLDRLALTNDPNNKGGKPISNRASVEAAQTDTTMKNVNKELGLTEDAPETSTLAEVQKIKNRAGILETENAALKMERDELLAAQVEADLETHKAVIKNRDAVKAQLLANRKGTLELLAAMQPAAEEAPYTGPIHNRQGTRQPGSPIATEKDRRAQEQRAARISNRARELRSATPSLGLPEAYAAATAELDDAATASAQS